MALRNSEVEAGNTSYLRSQSQTAQAFDKHTRMLGNNHHEMESESGSPEDFLPPSGPPPMLTAEEISFLSLQGWLPIELPEPLQQELNFIAADAAHFFEKDDNEKKALYPPRNGTECGYYVVPEEKEYLTFRHRSHEDSNLEQHVSSAWQLAASLLRRVLCDLGEAHGVDRAAWDDMINDCLQLPESSENMKDNISLMRLFQYYPSGFADHHTDVGLLTLCVGGGDGLQVADY